jgi:hypothetical protein
MVEVATPNGTINHSEGTNKNELWGLGAFRSPSSPDERRNPHSSGRTDRNWFEVVRIHYLEKSMVRHSYKTSESWVALPWKKFRRNLFRLHSSRVQSCSSWRQAES